MSLILLRHLPMVDVIEYRIETDGLTDDVEAWCDQLAEDLFGISEHDIDAADWDTFPVLHMMRDESDAYWASHGWDVTDGNGKQLAVMEFLARPMVCVVEKRHPQAQFKLAGEDWARKLEEEAKRFRPTR
jgi:hypothetical protein